MTGWGSDLKAYEMETQEDDFDIIRKKDWLDNLFYNIGKQQYDFSLQIISGTMITHRKKYSEVCFDCDDPKNQWWLEKCNQRQILPNEIVLDLEDPAQLQITQERLKILGLTFSVFATGSRGYHIHIFFNHEISDDQRIKILQLFGADPQKTSKSMIALEYATHWKSGKIKEQYGN